MATDLTGLLVVVMKGNGTTKFIYAFLGIPP